MRVETVEILGRPLYAYLPEPSPQTVYRGKRPAVLILPGGGYAYTYDGEGEPIALRFAAEGIAAFVLKYTCTDEAPKAFPAAVREGFAAIRHLREHAEEYGIDPCNISACGFSAGGHLCACLGTLWNKPEAEQDALFEPGAAKLCRPDKLILSYPVIRFAPPCNEPSACNFFGETPDEARRVAFSLQNRVDRETPPAFLWSTSDDDCVPVASSLQFAEALSAHGVHFELHIWPSGPHGLSLGNQVTQPFRYGKAHEHAVAAWARDAVRFLYE